MNLADSTVGDTEKLRIVHSYDDPLKYDIIFYLRV